VMRVAVLAESDADARALYTLASAVLAVPMERTLPEWDPPEGWPNLLGVIPVALRACYLNNLADGVICAADSDDDPIHVNEDEHVGGTSDRCRFCRIEKLISLTIGSAALRAGRKPLRTAIAIASPAIEAWYLFGREPHAKEDTWIESLKRNEPSRPFRLRLKKKVYDTERVGRNKKFRRAIEEAERLKADVRGLEAAFPNGFGAFARQLRTWVEP
jgi:hypothetical protein